MDYKDTINLPSTDLPMKAGLSAKEPKILDFWKKENIYNQIRAERKEAKKFILHDGPPYANGDIHLGHAVNKVLKDIVIKYQTLMGYDAPYVPGWDCHGLPIELSIEKKHGKNNALVKDKKQFLEACRKYADIQISNQKDDFIRLGVLGDWDNSYKSMDAEFEADIVRALGRIVANGHLEKGEKPVHWCFDCKSALAEAEVEYSDKTSKAIYVKFDVQEKSIAQINSAFAQQDIKTCSAVIWTTTPWTLPANVAVCVGQSIEYSLCNLDDSYLIIASDLVSACSEKWDKKINILSTCKGETLEGITLDHPFIQRQSFLICGDHVTVESGTGLVHTAPSHGVDDHNVCKKNQFKTIHAIDNRGYFKEEYERLSGKPVLIVDEEVISLLKENKKLMHVEDYFHSYPHCWRHKTPLIFACTPQWFISMNKSGLLDGAINSVDGVKWHPSWGKERILSMLEERPDWCISRQRSWGVPIPLIVHNETGELHPKQSSIFNEIADLIKTKGIESWGDVNLNEFIDDGENYHKTIDILDVWFDSGVTHFAVLDKLYGADLVADLYLEGSDQHRGWFQSSLLTGIAINGTAPYKSVLTHGFVVDEEGRKQSKSLGNVIAPQKIWNSLGADILRLWIANTDFRSEMVASDEIFKRVSDQYRRIRNTLRFLVANLDDFDVELHSINVDELLEIDKWIISKTYSIQSNVLEHYKNYEFHQVIQKIHNFCVNDLGGFYLDVTKDRQYTTQTNSDPRRSAQTAINIVLNVMVRLISPILSFTAEEIWQSQQSLKNQFKSVFLSLQYDFSLPQSNLTSENWRRVLEIRNFVNQSIEEARNHKQIKGSLDADLKLEVMESDYKLLSIFETELHFLFITSSCELIKSNTLRAKLSTSDHPKCVRCWHHCKTVGISKSHPEICSRCELNITGDGEERKFV